MKKKTTHAGHPSNVDTVNNVSIPLATLSKLNLLLSHLRSLITGALTSPLSNTRYVPL